MNVFGLRLAHLNGVDERDRAEQIAFVTIRKALIGRGRYDRRHMHDDVGAFREFFAQLFIGNRAAQNRHAGAVTFFEYFSKFIVRLFMCKQDFRG